MKSQPPPGGYEKGTVVVGPVAELADRARTTRACKSARDAPLTTPDPVPQYACPACGYELFAGARMCNECGHSLAIAQTSTARTLGKWLRIGLIVWVAWLIAPLLGILLFSLFV